MKQAAIEQQDEVFTSQTTTVDDDPFGPPVETLASDDPFAAGNFAAQGEQVPTSIDDLSISAGAPSDEEFVLVSSDPRHYVKGTFLVVKRENEGFGKSYFLLTPAMATWAKAQPSLRKFVKVMYVFLYKVADGGYGLWLIPDSFNTWSVSDLQVANSAKNIFTRRYTDGKSRKGHSSDAINTAEVQFPDKPFTGADGLLKQTFGEAFVITATNHPTINRLLGK